MQYLSQPCIAVSHDSHTVQKPDDSESLSIRHTQVILNCYRNLPPDEKPIFFEMIKFVARHPRCGRLVSEAETKGLKELSEIFAYMQDNWVDPEPAH